MATYEEALELLRSFLVPADAQIPRERFDKYVDEAWYKDIMAAFQTQVWNSFQRDQHDPVTVDLNYFAVAFFNLGYEARRPALVWSVNNEEEP